MSNCIYILLTIRRFFFKEHNYKNCWPQICFFKYGLAHEIAAGIEGWRLGKREEEPWLDTINWRG